jgi:VIT1/CCC1 family predicted Fe2+/Mn2+ transporter
MREIKRRQAQRSLDAEMRPYRRAGMETNERGKTACKDGAERLRQAADKRVGWNSEELADLLTAKALKGDLASTRVLVTLAASKKPLPERVKKRHGLSLAQRLAAEPQWKDTKDI